MNSTNINKFKMQTSNKKNSLNFGSKKRFFKKQMLLESILFQYMEWRELLGANSPHIEFLDKPNATKAFKNFHTKQLIQKIKPQINLYPNLHFPKSSSYWLFPLVGLITKYTLLSSQSDGIEYDKLNCQTILKNSSQKGPLFSSKKSNFLGETKSFTNSETLGVSIARNANGYALGETLDTPNSNEQSLDSVILNTKTQISSVLPKITENLSSNFASSSNLFNLSEQLNKTFLEKGSFSILWSNGNTYLEGQSNSPLLFKIDPLINFSRSKSKNLSFIENSETKQPIQSYVKSAILLNALLADETTQQLKQSENGFEENLSLNFHKFLTQYDLLRNLISPMAANQALEKKDFMQQNTELIFDKEKTTTLSLYETSLTPSVLSQNLLKIIDQFQPQSRAILSPQNWKHPLKKELEKQLKKSMLGGNMFKQKVLTESFDRENDLNMNGTLEKTPIIKLKTPLFGSNNIINFVYPEALTNSSHMSNFTKINRQQAISNIQTPVETSDLAGIRLNFKKFINSILNNISHSVQEDVLVINSKSDQTLSILRKKLLNVLMENWKEDFQSQIIKEATNTQAFETGISRNANDEKTKTLGGKISVNSNGEFKKESLKARNIEKILRSYLSVKKRDTQNSVLPNLVKNSKHYIDLLKFDLQERSLKPSPSVLSNLEGPSFNSERKMHKEKLSAQAKFQKTTPYNFLNKKGLIFLRHLELEKNSELGISIARNANGYALGDNFSFVRKSRQLARLEKLKIQQKHRRRKKQRRETRRRKKRKRVYPRPLWIRFKFYQKFLNLRHRETENLSYKNTQTELSDNSLFNKNNSLKSLNKNLRQKIYRTNKLFSSPTREKMALKRLNYLNTIPIFSENRFYYIPKFLLSEFQRSLLKSYWLKANLTPYLRRIQISLDNMRTTQKNLNSFKKLFLNILNLSNEQSLGLYSFAKANEPVQASLLMDSFYPSKEVLPPHLKNFRVFNSDQPTLNFNTNFYEQTALHSKLIDISEYNHILSQRIFYLIKNIKYNLAGNGNLRIRPYHSGRKRPEKIESKNIWTLLNQILNFEFFSNLIPKSNIDQSYRTYWALNKTNLFAFKDQNSYEKLWNFSKYREQKKSNQTKRILSKLKRSLAFEKDYKLNLEITKLQNSERKLLALVSPQLNDPTSFFKMKEKSKAFKLQTPKRRLYFWWNCIPTSFVPITQSVSFGQNNWQESAKKNNSDQFLGVADGVTRSVNSTSFSTIETNLLNFCFISVHFAIIFSVLQISQVRSLLKVVFLVTTKFVNTYCFLLNWTIQRYQTTQIKLKLIDSAFERSLVSASIKNNNGFSFARNDGLGETLENVSDNFNQDRSLDNLVYQKSQTLTSFAKKINFIRYAKTTKFWSEIRGESPALESSFDNSLKTKQISRVSLLVKPLVSPSSFIVSSTIASTNWRLLSLTKLSVTNIYAIQKFSYAFCTKILESFEGFLAFIYQFLEKPAEFMIDWIGQLFLIEWSAHLSTYMPENLENSLWKTLSKFSRHSYIFGIPGLLIQRRFFIYSETFLNLLIKSETDLIMRQKKSQIFWEIWSEILVRAVTKYNMNLSSLTTIKDEQDRLLENLLQDPTWDWSSTSLQKLTPYFEFKNLQSIQHWFIKNSNLTADGLRPSSFLSTKESKSVLISQNLVNRNSAEFAKPKQGKDWHLYQSVTLQARESDLFLEFSPPTSFKTTRPLKNATSVQQNLGNVICDIYSNILTKKIAKNILVIGPAGREKTLLIQALAGETELKIMTDNANRYAIVQRGIPIGMKLLRDVFEGLALNAPCIFLIEDIHAIGEKRSFLISEDQITSTDTSLGAERDEIHERNQMIAQITRHMITHYKKPYKGDFSMSIPTNRFNFQLFLGVTPPRTRRSNLTIDNPLDLKEIEQKDRPNSSMTPKTNTHRLMSILQLPSQEKFAPPATSPFSLLVLREQKKFKPKKRVGEQSWFGQSSQSVESSIKAQYSVRVKVAMLADLAISNLSAKLDMITELLVIIDSVRSNHGFLVFATTHVPYKLDPALRRPGRLDETLNLALQPSLKDRLEMIKLAFSDHSFVTVTNFDLLRAQGGFETKLLFDMTPLNGIIKQSLTRTFNAFDYALLFESKPEMEIQQLFLTARTKRARHIISPNRFAVEDSKTNPSSIILTKESNSVLFTPSFNLSKTNKSEILPFALLKEITSKNVRRDEFITTKFIVPGDSISLETEIQNLIRFDLSQLFSSSQQILARTAQYSRQKALLRNSSQKQNFNSNETALNVKSSAYGYLRSGLLNLQALIYGKTTELVVGLLIQRNVKNYKVNFSTLAQENTSVKSIFNILYASNVTVEEEMMTLFAKNIGQFLIFSSFKPTKFGSQNTFTNLLISNHLPPLHLINQIEMGNAFSSIFSNHSLNTTSAHGFLTTVNQKRRIYQQNSLIFDFLSFNNSQALKEPPGPNVTSILKPLKKYENTKRTHEDYQIKPQMTIQEKIQLHQQQRFLKALYQKPIQHLFKNLSSKHGETPANGIGFNNSLRDLGYYDKILFKPSSINIYYRNRILNRHRYYYTNQWWTGQLPEHNIEVTFASDVDWRSRFIESNPTNLIHKDSVKKMQKASSNLQDILIDFPDPDQYYNPRMRRWILNTGVWATWNELADWKTGKSSQFSSYLLLKKFHKTYNTMSAYREKIDYISYLLLRYGKIQEMDLIGLNPEKL